MFEELRAAYEGMFFLDAKCVFVTERTVLAGALDGLKVLILPRASHAPLPVVTAVAAWVQRGGVLLAVGPCFTHDQANRPIATALADTPAGKGRIILRTAPENWDQYHRLGDELLAQAGVARPIRAVDAEGQPITGIELRTTLRNGRRLIYLINMNKAKATVSLQGLDRPVVDLITARRIDWPYALSPLEVLLLEEAAAGD